VKREKTEGRGGIFEYNHRERKKAEGTERSQETIGVKTSATRRSKMKIQDELTKIT